MGGDVKELIIFPFKQVCEWELCLKSTQHGPGKNKRAGHNSFVVCVGWSVTDGGGVQEQDKSVCVYVDKTARDLDVRSVVKMLLIFSGNRYGVENQYFSCRCYR